MWVLRSAPPQTLTAVRPASRATSMNWTGDLAVDACNNADLAEGMVAASRTAAERHFHSGVVRASSSELPKPISEDPRKRRRGIMGSPANRENRFLAALGWTSM